ncbi:MAG: hypothetical protein ACFFCS_09735 [Candidatus Hodarchaeota archaeon]
MISIHADLDIIHADFKPLPREILGELLTRTLEYGYLDYKLDHEESKLLIDENFDYKDILVQIHKTMLDNDWCILHEKPAENRVPVFIFQKAGVRVFFAGASAGELSGLIITITTSSKADLQYSKKFLVNLAF